MTLIARTSTIAMIAMVMPLGIGISGDGVVSVGASFSHATNGQRLVSDGFETRIGRADKAKPIQPKKFSIHALGHLPTFSAL